MRATCLRPDPTRASRANNISQASRTPRVPPSTPRPRARARVEAPRPPPEIFFLAHVRAASSPSTRAHRASTVDARRLRASHRAVTFTIRSRRAPSSTACHPFRARASTHEYHLNASHRSRVARRATYLQARSIFASYRELAMGVRDSRESIVASRGVRGASRPSSAVPVARARLSPSTRASTTRRAMASAAYRARRPTARARARTFTFIAHLSRNARVVSYLRIQYYYL